MRLPTWFRGSTKLFPAQKITRRGEGGFALLEAVVALIVLSAVSGAGYSLFAALREGVQEVKSSLEAETEASSGLREEEMWLFRGGRFRGGDEQRN